MSSNSKLSLEERLKLATQSGGKKKGKSKKSVGSRIITPIGSETPEPEPEIVIEKVETPEPEQGEVVVDDTIIPEVIETPIVEREEEVNEEVETEIAPVPVVELNLSKDFMLQFNLSPTYYKDFNNQQVLDSLQDAILQKLSEIQEKNTSELQKVSKRETKLANQISSLQKEKVKSDLTFEKINNELEITKNKLSNALTELENIKPKFEEINKEYTDLQTKVSSADKSSGEKDDTIKALQIKLEDTTSRLNNFKLDNDSYAQRESELIDEITTIKSDHEKEISILENKIEQYKAKLEDMNLKSSMSYDADEFFKNDNITREIDALNEKMREQNDSWLNKYQSLSKENADLKRVIEDTKKENNKNSLELQSTLLKMEELSASTVKFEKENKELSESVTKLQNETLMKNNQINKLKLDLKSANELNKVHSKQLQDVIKKNLKQMETRRVASIPSIKTPDIESLYEKEDLSQQLRDEWNIENVNKPSLDNISEDGSMASSLNFTFKSPELNTLKSFNFKGRHHDSLTSQQLLDIDEEDPLLQRQSSDAGITPGTSIDINLVARLNNKIRSLEYDLEYSKHTKDKAAAEKADQQRKLNEMQQYIDKLKTFEKVNNDLVKEKLITSQKLDNLENEITMKNRRIMELTEDLKDMKELMHHQIQEIMSAADK